jgi:hypothetical protein
MWLGSYMMGLLRIWSRSVTHSISFLPQMSFHRALGHPDAVRGYK